MIGESVRAEYRYGPAPLVIVPMLGLAVALPFAALFIDVAPGWQEALFIALAVGLGCWWVLRRFAYRMELTDTALVLRVALGRVRIPFDDLDSVGTPAHPNGYEVIRGDRRTWLVMAGDGYVAFLEELSRLSPRTHVEITHRAVGSDNDA